MQEWRRVRSAVRIGHAHHDQKTALRMRRAGDEPFAPVDDVIVAVAHHPGGDVGRVGGSDIGLGHAERRTGFGFQQRLQPARLLLRRGAVLQRDHVRNVRRLAVEDFRRPEQPAHDFGQRRVFEIGKPRAGLAVGEFGQAEIPQARRARLLLQVAHERRGLAVAGDVFEPGAMARQHLGVEERLQLAPPLLRSARKVRNPCRLPLLGGN